MAWPRVVYFPPLPSKLTWGTSAGAIMPRYPYAFIVQNATGPDDRSDLVQEIERWCTEQFGNDEARWKLDRLFNFLFRDLDDATHFRLRWT